MGYQPFLHKDPLAKVVRSERIPGRTPAVRLADRPETAVPPEQARRVGLPREEGPVVLQMPSDDADVGVLGSCFGKKSLLNLQETRFRCQAGGQGALHPAAGCV